MKKITLFSCLLSVILLQANAQQLSFQKLYSTSGPSNQGRSIIEQSNGDFIVSGIRSVPMGGGQYVANIYLFRINSVGDTVWTREIGTPHERELTYNMIQLPNRNLVIVGSFNIPPAGLSDALIVCCDSAGNVLWQKKYGGSNTDYATNAVFDGQHIVVCGRTESYGAGQADAWLLKLTQAGDTVWTRTYGGADLDDAWDIEVAHNSYYFTGGTYSFASGLYDDAWVVKTDMNGNKLWHKTYGLTDRVDWAWALTPVTTGGTVTGFVFTGIKDTEPTPPGTAYGQLHFAKIDTAGNLVWDKSISGGAGTSWRREGFDIKQLPDNGFIICGYKLDPAVQSQQLYAVKTNSDGDVQWETSYGTTDSNYYANALTVTSDGGWAITGSIYNGPTQIRYIYVTRFSPYNTSITNTVATAGIIFYPNPATEGRVTIKIPTGISVNKILLLSITGQLLKVYYPAQAEPVMIDLPVAGNYIAEVYTDKGTIRRKLSCINND